MAFEKLFIVCLGIAFTPWIACTEIPRIPDHFINLNRSVHLEEFANKDCSIRVNGDLKEPQPLFIVPNSAEFYNPDNSGVTHIPAGAEIEFHCNTGFVAPFTNAKILTAKCISGLQFDVNGKPFTYDKFLCTKTNSYTARQTARKCYDNSMIVEIGFAIANNRFAKLMEVCHNAAKGSTYYVQHTLNPFNGNHQRNVERPFFQQGKFFKNINVNKLYTQVQQVKTVAKILGNIHKKYFDIPNYVYLARGHMSAKADYIYGSQQLGTFFYVNVAPQWQTFNAGNWLAIEESVRTYLAKKKIFADLYTGTWGVSSLKDDKGAFRELYLHLDPQNANANKIPVPKLYYKVVIDRKSKKGIVLLGVNNPHLTLAEIKKDYLICNDISDKIDWINWKKDDILAGYSYACSVPDFEKVVKHLPTLNVKGILGV